MKRIAVLCACVVIFCGISLGQSYQVLYSFGANSADGLSPTNNLVADGSGNLYGTTATGGAAGTCTGTGCGTVFELSPNGHGGWTENTIYTFCNGGTGYDCPDGGTPRGLAIDGKGDLFGTTQYGGNPVENGVCNDGVYGIQGCGVAYELSPPSTQNGSWTYTLLYAFCSEGGTNCTDGAAPIGWPTLDASGNLYGTVFYGGNRLYDAGVVFKLSQTAGVWTETNIYNFCSQLNGVYCADGESPTGGVTFDRKGNLYATVLDGGSATQLTGGALVRLSPGQSVWTNTVLNAFPMVLSQGFYWGVQPGPVTVDPAGNIYTTTEYGAKSQSQYPLGAGRVFQLTSKGQKNVFFFGATGGAIPYYGVTIDAKRGVAYGTTSQSAQPDDFGAIFQLTKSGNETVLYTLCSESGCADGNGFSGPLLEDAVGNLYGVTDGGGVYKGGVVYELTP